ncbi:hypothetical protein E2C01_031016 [Portunus trituberculatus]|uniref:Uncharacterized protein n=1 Tax=Portunus trituberculatus TaxID=210409 RepID=A0A5B7EXF7_PORTR|nr:hypothetical protein [Portunus trituberculatus]
MLIPYLLHWAPHFCILSYFSNPFSGFLKAEVPLAFYLYQMGDLRRYYVDFPWSDYCFRVRDPSFCAERTTETFFKNSTLDDSGLVPISS